MAHKTFISYKYDEAQKLRDKIIDALGEDATYYQGETSESPDLTNRTTETIKKHLKEMIHGTSVTIVIISPNMKKSNWISWEISYSLKEISVNEKKSLNNGILAVIMKYNGGYDWFKTVKPSKDHCQIATYKEEKVFDIIKKNHFNQKNVTYACEACQTFDALTGSYISYIEEEQFLNNPSKYIENAYKKSKDSDQYDIYKQ